MRGVGKENQGVFPLRERLDPRDIQSDSHFFVSASSRSTARCNGF